MIPEDLMRKYKYGYVHSCEILNEPFVKDLIKENQKYKAVIDQIKRICNSVPYTWSVCGIDVVNKIEKVLKEV